MILQCLHIKNTARKGRGIYTKKQIPTDTVVEVAPVIVMQAKDRIAIDTTLLHDYIFEWGDDKTLCAMALGNIPIYNHSYKSNCEYYMDYDEHTMYIKTVRLVKANEELTINYNGVWNDEKPLWFEAI